MPKPYSPDLRKKVMIHVLKGNGFNTTSLKFDVSENTVRNWYKRYQLEGHYNERIHPGKKPRVTLNDIEDYVASTPNFKLSEIGHHFEITASGALYWVKKFGCTYTKTLTYVEACPKKRGTYLKRNSRYR